MVSFGRAPFRFGVFELDPQSGELRRHGLVVRLSPQAQTLLCMLVEPPIRMRTREEIQQRLWPANTYVDFEHSLNKVVHFLRQALGDSAANPRFIETVATQGYRFLPAFMEHCVVSRGRDEGAVYLAVLPIAAPDGSELRFLAGRITSRLTDELSALDGLRVIAESTVRNSSPECTDAQRAGEALGVRSVVTGEMTQHDDVVYLRTELVEVIDGRHLHGAQAEVLLQQATRCEAELAREIALQMTPSLLELVAKARRPREPLVLNRRATDRRVNIA